ncbi:MAG: hypothetical protein J7605_02725 [Variovorax sp.]|nr:hypothetical protein [Variovorax sp.]
MVFFDQIGVGRTVGYRMIRMGEIETVRVGRKLMVTPEGAAKFFDKVERVSAHDFDAFSVQNHTPALIDKLLAKGNTISSIAAAVSAARSTVRAWHEGRTEPGYSDGLRLQALANRPAARPPRPGAPVSHEAVAG